MSKTDQSTLNLLLKYKQMASDFHLYKDSYITKNRDQTNNKKNETVMTKK